MADEIEKNEKVEYEAKKEYLMSYRIACRRIDNLKEQLDSLREVEQSAKTQQLSDMPRGGGSGQQDLSVLMERIEELQTEIHNKINESIKIRLDIEYAISELNDDMELEVLWLRYIKFMKWREICKKTGYAEANIYRFHANAINNLKMIVHDSLTCVNI